MAQKHRYRNQQPRRAHRAPPPSAPSMPRPVVERKAPVVYGEPIVILEDEGKNTFEFLQGAWVPFSMSIAECRRQCLVKVLPQSVNRKTRYEVRRPVDLIE